MTDSRKRTDKEIWKRMGAELVFLEELISAIRIDGEYNAVMDMKTWDKLGDIQQRVSVLRSHCEERMAKFVPDWTTETFYPHERGTIRATLEECRERLRDDLTNTEAEA